MNKELNANNSKKLIIGVSIMFCTVILIIGVTTAFFTQSGSGTTGNIVTTDINGTIGYTDNNDYMRNDLIPVMGSDVDDFAMKNSLNGYTDNDICVYTSEYNACSLYEFTITNNANVSQEFNISMTPTLNGYSNLYYILYEGEQDILTTSSTVAKYNTHIDKINTSEMVNGLVLKPNESKTYTVVFYIKNLETVDQTSVDAGKTYAATINVNSVTTGDYISVSLGEGCYETELLEDGTYKLTKFNGINEDGSVVEGCGVTQDSNGYYSVIIPSVYGGQQISTLGNTLFVQADLENFDSNDLSTLKTNKNSYIKEFEINEGITTVEDGFLLDAGSLGDIYLGTFVSTGYDYFNSQVIIEDGVKFDLPNSLKYIGESAFNSAYIKEIDLPNNLEYIGDRSIANNDVISEISIPVSVTTIGYRAFVDNNLTKVTFEGALDGTSKLTTIGDYAFADNNITSIVIPPSVEMIGERTFGYNYNLTSLTFGGALDGTSKLKEIGPYAFSQHNLIYETQDKPLMIPSSVIYISTGALSSSDSKLNYIYFAGDYSGFGDSWNGDATIITE